MSHRRLLDLVNSMERDGLVDNHFRLVLSMKDENGPFFMSDLINKYCSDTNTTLTEMTKTLEESSINFRKLEQLCLKMKGGTSCLCIDLSEVDTYADVVHKVLGACRIAMACGDFRKAVVSRSKDQCILSLNHMKHEFFTLQDRLNAFVEVDKRIAARES